MTILYLSRKYFLNKGHVLLQFYTVNLRGLCNNHVEQLTYRLIGSVTKVPCEYQPVQIQKGHGDQESQGTVSVAKAYIMACF